MNEMKLKISKKNEVNIVRIEGAIRAGDEFHIAEKIEKCIAPGVAPKFIIDMEKVPFLNSAALGVFLSVYKHVEGLNGRIVFTGLSSEVEKLLEITRLSSVFEVFRNVGEAMESFTY